MTFRHFLIVISEKMLKAIRCQKMVVTSPWPGAIIDIGWLVGGSHSRTRDGGRRQRTSFSRGCITANPPHELWQEPAVAQVAVWQHCEGLRGDWFLAIDIGSSRHSTLDSQSGKHGLCLTVHQITVHANWFAWKQEHPHNLSQLWFFCIAMFVVFLRSLMLKPAL